MEYISWATACEQYGPNSFVKAPSVKATHQGLDGIVVVLDGGKQTLLSAVVLEDKCTINPRNTFRCGVLPYFRKFQSEKDGRWREFAAVARETIDAITIPDETKENLCKQLSDLSKRAYRAAIASSEPTMPANSLFKGYEKVGTKELNSRMGATFSIGTNVRVAFDKLAERVIIKISEISDV